MKKSMKSSLNSNIYNNIARLGIKGSEREEAIYALSVGEAIADTILGITNSIKKLSAGTATKPSYRHHLAA